MLDIGCGGGLLSEPLARLGADMVGVDPSGDQHRGGEGARRAIASSRSTTAAPPPRSWPRPAKSSTWCWRWRWSSTSPTCRCSSQSCAEMVKPGGLMIAATFNRTLKSFALAIVGAEYILRWLPVGSHRWDKFVTPNELEIAMEQGGLQVIGSQGVIYNILADRWQLSSDMDVNYMLVGGALPIGRGAAVVAVAAKAVARLAPHLARSSARSAPARRPARRDRRRCRRPWQGGRARSRWRNCH